MVSVYWANQGKTVADIRPGKTFQRSDGLACDECCNGMIPQDECHHAFRRESCPYCLGTSLNANCFNPSGARIRGGPCACERLNEDGICRQCGADRRRG